MPEPSVHDERRAAARAPIALRVRARNPGGGGGPFVARDFSTDGVFLFTRKPFDIGARLELEIELPGVESLALDGVVVRAELVQALVEPPGLSGMGIRFEAMSESDRERLGRLVEGVRRALAAAGG